MVKPEFFEQATNLSTDKKENWKQIIMSFTGWSIQQGLCPTELQCCGCFRMKTRFEVAAVFFTDPFAEPLCGSCLADLPERLREMAEGDKSKFEN